MSTVRVTLNGCDASTCFEIEATDQELNFLRALSIASKETSYYGCMPTLDVYTQEDEEYEWYAPNGENDE